MRISKSLILKIKFKDLSARIWLTNWKFRIKRRIHA